VTESSSGEKLSLAQLVDLPRLTALLQALHRHEQKYSLALMDRDNQMLAAVGFQQICADFHRQHPHTEEKCVESNRLINERLFDGPYTMYKCPNGIIDIAFPIVIDEQYVGTFWIGQVLTEEPDLAFFEEQAATCGFDREAYLAALEKVPMVPHGEIERAIAFYQDLVDFIVDLGLKNQRLTAQNELIEQQSQALRRLATPILEVGEDVLVLPIIGTVDTARATTLAEDLLQQVAARAAEHVILDLTGMAEVDHLAARNLVEIMRATQLLGARCLITGIRPDVAKTLVGGRIDLGQIPIYSTLKTGLASCR